MKVRLFCPECGKRCGHVEVDAGRRTLVTTLLGMQRSRLDVRQDLAKYEWFPMNCPSRHRLVLLRTDLDNAKGTRLVVRPERWRERADTNGLDRYGRGVYHEDAKLWERYDLPDDTQ